MEKDNELRTTPPEGDAAPQNIPEEKNELHEKFVFSGDPIKPSERLTDEEDDDADDEPAAPLDLHTPQVMDAPLAARKAQRAYRAAPPRRVQPKRAKQAAPRLASGEAPTVAVSRIVKEFLALTVFLALVCLGFWGKDLVMNFLTDGGYGAVYQSTTYASPVSCTLPTAAESRLAGGYAAAERLAEAFGGTVNPASFTKTADEQIFPSELEESLAAALPEHEVVLKADLSNLELFTQIHESLAAKKPVLILLSEAEGREISMQYALVTRMDAERDVITVWNPLSGDKTYTLEAFLEATRFKNYEDMPLLTYIGLTFGSFSRNTAVFVN